jgi:hypothetical protein
MVDSIVEITHESIKVFFVQKDLMALVTIAIKSLGTFSNRNIIIFPLGLSYIEKISPSLSSPDF